MDVESLIPFGLDRVSLQLVDVGSVKRGSACGCICPSCKTPLMARHGDKNAWHFAHRSQNVHDKTRKQCDYSFAVSVRLMIRQLSNNGLKFRTPGLESSAELFSEFFNKRFNLDYPVTEESLLELDDVEVGTQFSGVTVDVLGYVKGIPFIVFVTYKDRKIPLELEHPTITMCGVVELNVDSLPRLFKQEENGQYQEILRSFIEDKTDGKVWTYHPRQMRLQDSAMKKLESWVVQHETEYKKNNKTTYSYKCRLCNSTWTGSSRVCNKCETQIYTVDIDELLT